MEELHELRTYIEQGHYDDALNLIGEMEEMSKDDKINRILRYFLILQMHLIKQQAENRTTRSWNQSIYNAVEGIRLTNKRRKSGGYYLNETELEQACRDAYDRALKNAAFEVFEGMISESELAAKIQKDRIIQQALKMAVKDEEILPYE